MRIKKSPRELLRRKLAIEVLENRRMFANGFQDDSGLPIAAVFNANGVRHNFAVTAVVGDSDFNGLVNQQNSSQRLHRSK